MRRLPLFLSIVLVALLVVACSSGNAREAELGREQHASDEARLPGLQATYSSTFVDPGTPTPAPAPANLPALDRLVLTRSVGGNGPADDLASVPANFGTVYAGARLHGLSRGTVVGAIWRGERGDVHVSETTVDQDAGEAWVGLPLPLDGSLSPGNYAVILLVTVGDEPPVSLNSLVFEITAAGSQARAVQPGRAPRIVPNDGDADDDSSGSSETGTGSAQSGEFEDEGAPADSGDGQAPPIVPADEEE